MRVHIEGHAQNLVKDTNYSNLIFLIYVNVYYSES